MNKAGNTYYNNKGTNQLNWVHYTVPRTNYPNDINNETPNNYKYNGIGELAGDDSAKIDTITWTVYGKVKKIVKYSPLDSVVAYNYLNLKGEGTVFA